MTIPLDIVIALAALSFCLGMFVDRCIRPHRPRWPRFDHDMRGMVPLSGASERFFRHDLSDTKEIG